MKYILFLFALCTLTISCNSNNGGSASTKNDGFESAYPKMYTDLGLPQYRRGTLESVTGGDEGVKTKHLIQISTEDGPLEIQKFIEPAMKDLGWRDTNARRRLSDIAPEDLYYAKFIKGLNKFDVNAATTPSGKTKLKITLSTFNQTQ